MLKAILILPGNVLITIPAIILYLNGFTIIPATKIFSICVMFLLFSFGLGLMIWTMKLFSDIKHGSPAPWNPINKLITYGPYAYSRNPMLSGVFLFLGGECLLFQSLALFYYLLIFILINAIYFPLWEEKDLQKRYGKEYEAYKQNVPRFLPRLKAWKK